MILDPRKDPRQVSMLGPEHEKELQVRPKQTKGGNALTKWVKQEHTFGCVLASLAMVVGKTYREIHDSLAPKIWRSVENRGKYEWKKGNDFNQNGWYMDDAYRWLEEQGYATQMRYHLRWAHVKRNPWPPKPFAPVHMVSVVTPSDAQHAIVYTSDGQILDPNREPGTWEENWDFYKKVDHVCGIWKVGKFSPLKYD